MQIGDFNLTEEQLIIGVIILAVLFIINKGKSNKKSKTNEDGKIIDDFVTRDLVLEKMEDFKPKLDQKLKIGYTEKSIQNQLKNYLKKYFDHVNDEYVIGGLNASKMDIDVGQGGVGIELKLAEKVYKSSEFDRLTGQLRNYSKSKYGNDNLIVAIIGDKNHQKERSHIQRIKDLVEEFDGVYLFLKVPIKKESKESA